MEKATTGEFKRTVKICSSIWSDAVILGMVDSPVIEEKASRVIHNDFCLFRSPTVGGFEN